MGRQLEEGMWGVTEGCCLWEAARSFSCVLTEQMTAGSKMSPLLAKATPPSDSSSTSGVTDLRKGKNRCGRSCFISHYSTLILISSKIKLICPS